MQEIGFKFTNENILTIGTFRRGGSLFHTKKTSKAVDLPALTEISSSILWGKKMGACQ